MGDLKNIFNKLNIIEQAELNKYINIIINTKINEMNVMIDEAKKALDKDNKEMKEYYTRTNAETWDRVEASLHTGMKENHISDERIDKIFARVKELNQKHDLLIGEEQKSEYKILKDADFQQMIYLLMDNSCKNCNNSHKRCEVYELLKKYNIPHSGCKGKCKYAYYKIGKRVV